MTALCEKLVQILQKYPIFFGMDKRIGEYFLQSGPGFGGSCFKKDILNLVYISKNYGLNEVAEYWEKVIDINNPKTRKESQNIC